MTKKGLHRVMMTEEEYNKWIKGRDTARRNSKYNQLLNRMRPHKHHEKSIKWLLMEVFSEAVLDKILETYNPVPPPPPMPREVAQGNVRPTEIPWQAAQNG